MRQKLIVVEGADGVGKSSVVEGIFRKLPDPKISTREPGSPHIEVNKEIRELVKKYPDLQPETYARLFSADTFEHLYGLVIPKLKEGSWVVSDRSVISDYAYRPLAGDEVRRMNMEQLLLLEPLVIYVVADPTICMKRLKDRGIPLTHFEVDEYGSKITKTMHDYQKHALPKLDGSNAKLVIVPNVDDLESAIDKAWRAVVNEWKGELKHA
jgi:dTMP kinase